MSLIRNFFSKIDANHQYKLAIEEHKKGKIDNAIILFTRALEKHEDHLPSLYSRGSLYIDVHRWDKALEDLEKVRKISPNADSLNFLLGICQSGLKNYQKGLIHFGKAIEEKPNRPEPYWNRALLYKNNDENEKALIDINKAIAIRDNDYTYYCIKAQILENLKRNEEAIECYDKGIEFEKGDRDSLQLKIGFLQRINEKAEALKGINILIEQHPYDPNLFAQRGEIKESTGDLSGAIEDYNFAYKSGLQEMKVKLEKLNSSQK